MRSNSHIIISEFERWSVALRPIVVLSTMVLVAGCESAHVGMGIPVPGPVKPSVGVTVNKSGVKGTGGVSAKVGSVPVYAGGVTKPINLTETSEPTKSSPSSQYQ